LAAAPRKE
jgi:DNA-binding GntR family transcriptional regulator